MPYLRYVGKSDRLVVTQLGLVFEQDGLPVEVTSEEIAVLDETRGIKPTDLVEVAEYQARAEITASLPTSKRAAEDLRVPSEPEETIHELEPDQSPQHDHEPTLDVPVAGDEDTADSGGE